MKEGQKLFLAIIIIFVFFGFLFMGASKDKNQTQDILNVAVTDGERAEWLLDFAEKKGFFEEAGLKINKIEAGVNRTALLTSGEVDLTNQMVASSLTPFFNDEDIKLIAVTQYSSDNYGVSRYPEENISQIKRVGVPRIGGAFHISIIPVLQTLGVDMNKVEYVTMGSAIGSRIALLESGEIDFTLIDPEDIKGLEVDKFFLISPEKLYEDSYGPRGVLTNQAVIDTKSKEIQIYIDVLARTLIYVEENRAELVSYFSESFELSTAEAERYYDESWDVRIDKGFVPEGNILESLIEATIDLAKPKNPTRNLGEFIDTSFAEKAKNNY